MKSSRYKYNYKIPVNQYAFVHIPKCAGTSIKKSIINSSSKNIKYFPHGVRFKKLLDYSEVIVLRHPVSRFTSAFFYLSRRSHNKTIDTPDKLIDMILLNNPDAIRFMSSRGKFRHTINEIACKYNWVFEPQYKWLHNPKIIMIFENLDSDFQIFRNKFNVDLELRHLNISHKKEFDYSPHHIKYIEHVYKKDLELYNYFVNKKDRI